jgi:CBS domain-containing protein
MITGDTAAFLNRTPPFSFLTAADITSLASGMSLEFYPKGHTILRQNGPSAEHLGIIRSGAVKVFVRTNEGEEVLVDYRTSGDSFGLLSFACGDISRDTIVAEEDTTCYLLGRDRVLSLMKTNAAFADYCFRTRLKRLLDLVYREIRDRTLLYGGGDKLLFTNVLGDLAAKRVVTAPEDCSIREAAAIMAEHKISSLLLVDSQGLPSGLVTDRDLRNRVVAKGRDPEGRVGDIMSVTLIKSEARDYCFEALQKLMRYNIHHLLVVDKGELRGIITNHDLMMLQGASPLSVAREIENQDTIDGLVPVSRKIDRTITLLIREGAKAGHITRIISEINDRLLQKALAITQARLGPPPVGYCWIVYGSEGRKEQTFRTDQDNAIIYEDPAGDGEEARNYFSRFAASMREALERCGFPACTADYMASNPKWCQPFSVWTRYFSGWIQSPSPEAILQCLIFFDFRPVHGNILLAERLRAFLAHQVRDRSMFFARMAATVLQNRPPLGPLGGIVTDRRGPRKGTFNIKLNALTPVIDAARLSALEMQVYATSTLARLAELKGRTSTASPFAGELEDVFEFLMTLRLRHQYRQIEKVAEPDNFIDPRDLGSLDVRMLKEALKIVRSVQEAVRMQYDTSQAL